MTYTTASSIVGYQAIAPGWRAALIAHGALPDADTILAAYDASCRALHLDPNLALAQACHECTWFTSTRWTQEWNPAGLGITANNTPPNPFKTPQEGIQAHGEHLACHGYTLAECPCDHAHLSDRRHFFHTGNATLSDIQTPPYRWAAGLPGSDPLDYVRSIVSIANAIVGASPVSTVPWDRVHISADLGPTRTLDTIKWFIVHDTEGHFAGDEVVLTSAGPPVESANLLVGRVPGQCVLIAPLDTTAWAAGNDGVGEQAVQVELSKGTDETGYTDYQYAKLAEVFAYSVQAGMVNVPPVYLGLHPADANGGSEPDDAGIIGHAGVPNPAGLAASPPWGGFGGHTDPGPDFDWPRFIGLLGTAPQPPAPPSNPDARLFPETGKSISGNIKGYWERFGDDDVSLAVFGLPVTDPLSKGGIPTQYFERAVLEDHGGDVMGERIGSLVAKTRGYTGPGIP